MISWNWQTVHDLIGYLVGLLPYYGRCHLYMYMLPGYTEEMVAADYWDRYIDVEYRAQLLHPSTAI